MDLFESRYQGEAQPLAEKMRPQKFEDLMGQSRIFSENKLLLKKLKEGFLQSLILWGPPGCGKTSFATALMNEVSCEVIQENAIDLGAKKIREIGEMAKRNLYEGQRKTLVFVDEIHRLNRGQQDVLLPFVEKGYFYLVGATTENPSYQLNAALVSRCRLLVFEPLNTKDIADMALGALKSQSIEKEKIFSSEAFETLIEKTHGDARHLYNLLEEVLYAFKNSDLFFPMDTKALNALFESTGLRFDKKGDEHYDTISAFIKSVRGSDPDAAIYYLARMLEGGEDPVFIARRLVILASEDIGNADPQGLNIAVNTLQAVELVGMPEARITLAQATTYLASCPKSNSSYKAINKALSEVRKSGPLPIPKSLRSAKTPLMKDLGYGKGYNYAHEGQTGWVEQDFFPEGVKDRSFYEPVDRGFEKKLKEYLSWMRGEESKKSL